MFSLTDKIVCITGASSGIGAACARTFAQLGCRLLLAARRSERLEALASELRKEHIGLDVLTLTLDVRHVHEVEAAFASLPEEWKNISILINNAGLARGMAPLQEGDIADWEEMIDTNVKGLLYVTRTLLPGMIQRNEGHIINTGSIAGHAVYPKGNVYCASKYAVQALTEGIKMDTLGTPIRVSVISPGMVDTEFSTVRFHGDHARADATYKGMTPLSGEDVADIVGFIATRPAHVNILDCVILPTDQSAATLVHRR
ncbi:MAG TPA: SDR family NAD(P)-dependent oxidoreductase [Bacteroidota bacterium]|nr:SDR family NAD(P)-dependent oxidoreductase [Bacteroidota bacterium]